MPAPTMSPITKNRSSTRPIPRFSGGCPDRPALASVVSICPPHPPPCASAAVAPAAPPLPPLLPYASPPRHPDILRPCYRNCAPASYSPLGDPYNPVSSGHKRTGRGPVDARLDLIGIVTRDMRASLAFYRKLGLDVPEGSEDEPHAETTTPGGLRVAWDTAELIGQIYPDYTAPSGGHRMALAFLLPSPAAVDEKYAELPAPGHGRPA